MDEGKGGHGRSRGMSEGGMIKGHILFVNVERAFGGYEHIEAGGLVWWQTSQSCSDELSEMASYCDDP